MTGLITVVVDTTLVVVEVRVELVVVWAAIVVNGASVVEVAIDNAGATTS